MSEYLLIGGAEHNDVLLLEADSLTVAARLATAGRIAVLGASASGRYGFAIHRDDHCVSVIDVAEKTVKSVPTGQQPTHFHTHGSASVIFNDGSGSVSIFDDADIYAPLTVPATQPDHGSAVVIDGHVLAGHLRAGVVDIYTLGSAAAVQRIEGCPVLHGAAQVGDVALFGCSDGVQVVKRSGDSFVGIKLPNPPDTPPRVRVGLFATHQRSTWALGNFGQGLALIDPDGETLRVLPVPGHPIQFAFDADAHHALVLTHDGILHRLALPDGDIIGSVQVTAPVEPPKGPDGKPRPSMARGADFVYIVSPDEQTVVEVALTELAVTRQQQLAGMPRSIVSLRA